MTIATPIKLEITLLGMRTRTAGSPCSEKPVGEPQRPWIGQTFAVQRKELYILTKDEKGEVEYAGEVIGESNAFVRLEAVDPISLWFGFWSLTGDVYIIPRARCRVFSSMEACREETMRLVEKIRQQNT